MESHVIVIGVYWVMGSTLMARGRGSLIRRTGFNEKVCGDSSPVVLFNVLVCEAV